MAARYMQNVRKTLNGPVIADIGALQSPSARGRGIAKYILNFCLALENEAPELVSDYLLDRDLPPPGGIGELLSSGKISHAPSKPAFAAEAKMFLCMWPLDEDRPLGKIMPPDAKRNGLATAVVVYDMIPLLEKEYTHRDAVDKAKFFSRLEIIRSADTVFTISEKTKRDVTEYFHLSEDRVVTVGAATDKTFVPLTSAGQRLEKERLLGLEFPGLRPGYILCPTGSHPRKNNERLIKAFLALDKNLRQDRQLVFSGDLPESTINHFQYMASPSGDGSNIFATGQLPQDLLTALYQCAAFVVFPSLAEGFGLPIAEALACGKRVTASAISPFDELLDPEMLFDPLDTEDIRHHLAKELKHTGATEEKTGKGHLPATVSRQTPERLSSWEEIGKKTAAAIYAGFVTQRRTVVRKKKRLGIISPVPPAPSGVAAYTYRLMEELVKLGDFSITAFADGPFPSEYGQKIRAHTPKGVPAYQSFSLPMAEGLLGGFDQVLYCFGNSHHHLGALTCLPKRPGVVLAHDVRLTNLYRHYHGRPGIAQTGLAKDIENIYGIRLEESLCKNNELSPYAVEKYSLLLARRVIALSESYLVHSLAGRNLALMDAAPSDEDKISVIPFAIEKNTRFDDHSDWDNGEELASWLKEVKTRHLISHFGIVDPIKNPKLILDAYKKLLSVRDDAVLAFVGPIDKSLLRELEIFSQNLGVDKNVKFTGKVSAADFNRFLEQSSLAVQPRTDFNGEASAAVANTLAAGIPTVATDMGWVSDLPDDVIIKIPSCISDFELSQLLLELLSAAGRRKTFSDNAVSHASKYSFSHAAQVLSDLLLETC